MSTEDEGDRLIGELWRELADQEAPPPGLETRLAARARGVGRARRLSWFGWATAGLAVAGLSLFVMTAPPDELGRAPSSAVSEPSEDAALKVEAPAAAPEAEAGPPPAAPRRARPEPDAPERARPEPVAPERARPEPVAPERARPEPVAPERARPEPVAPGASRPQAKRAPLPAPVLDEAEDQAEDPVPQGLGLQDGRARRGESHESKGMASSPAILGAEEEAEGDGALAERGSKAAPSDEAAPNRGLRRALARLPKASLDAQRAAWRRAEALVRTEVDRAEWLYAEVGLLLREGDPDLAREKLRALRSLGSPRQRARVRRALSD